MPSVADYGDMQYAYRRLKSLLARNPHFHVQLMFVLTEANRRYIKFGWVCKEILAEPSNRFDYYWQNPRTAALLRSLQQELSAIKHEYFAEYCDLRKILRECRMAGYTNMCRMIMGKTPDELKGLSHPVQPRDRNTDWAAFSTPHQDDDEVDEDAEDGDDDDWLSDVENLEWHELGIGDGVDAEEANESVAVGQTNYVLLEEDDDGAQDVDGDIEGEEELSSDPYDDKEDVDDSEDNELDDASLERLIKRIEQTLNHYKKPS